MTGSSHRILSAVLVGLSLALATVAAADFTEFEDQPFQDPSNAENNPLSAASPVPWDDADFSTAFPDGVKLIRGTLDVGDVDAYAFSFAAGELVLGALFEDFAGERNDTTLGIFTGGTTPPLVNDDDAGSGFLSRFAFTTTLTSTHEISVTGFGDTAYDGSHDEAQDGLVPYWLVVAATTNPPPLAEVEGNDTPIDATPLPESGGVVGAALDAGDVDYYSIVLETGDRIAISVFDLKNGLFESAGGERNDALVGVFDPNDLLAAGGANDDGGPGWMSNLLFTAGSDGVWKVAVSGFGDDAFDGSHQEAGFDYLLVVARERACPNVTPLISSITASTANSYVLAELQGGDHYYTDRNGAAKHVLVDIPPDYLCSEWIKTANNDKNVTDQNHLNFTLLEDASVFIAYDTRATSEPAWLASAFTPLGEVVDIADPSPSQEFDLLRRDFAAGSVVLGGNEAPGANSNYSVFARPLPLGDPSQALPVPPGASAVALTISGVWIQVQRSPGDTTEEFTQAIAAAINADSTLSAARIYGLASGTTLVTTGTIESSSIARNLPALPLPGLVVLVSLLLGAGARSVFTARRSTR